MNYYLVTVKRVGRQQPNAKHYSLWMNKLNEILIQQNACLPEYKHTQVCEEYYEIDQHSRLHMHLIMLFNPTFNKNLLYFFKSNWHVDAKLLDSENDLQIVRAYLSKEEQKEFFDKLSVGEYLFNLNFN